MKQIGPNRYRGEIGRYYEDFEVGDIYEHRPGRTITEADNIQFSLLTMNQHPQHCDRAYAEKSEFLHGLLSKRYAANIKRFAVAIHRSCPNLDDRTIFWRFHFIMGSLIYVMADFGAASIHSQLTESEYFNTCCKQLINFALCAFGEKPTST